MNTATSGIFTTCIFGLGIISAFSASVPQSFRGITEPYFSSTISATVAGRIGVIKKKEGDFVKKGEVILELEKDEEELEVALRKLIAESKVEIVTAGHKDSVLKLEYESTKRLYESTRSVSEEELLKKELEYKLAAAETNRLATLEKREELEYRMALAQLRKRIITAPFDGIVVKIHPRIAENCNPQEPLVRVATIGRCRFITHVDAKFSTSLAAGMKVNLSFADSPVPSNLEGLIEFVSPVVDPSSGLRDVKIVFENSDRKVKPGVSGSMSLAENP